ncbi:NUDIX domain-containing protein [Nonomuraea sp. NPDC046802]|uniref:NUDIX domain-containing protein n=1 Tax=Nonomuraea sp. NPDC046802 TaxID=3154919 RepID=UPI0033D8F0FA
MVVGSALPEYAVFQRADDSHWQSVSGGVEEREDLATAARRETTEEGGLAAIGPLFKLDMVRGVEGCPWSAASPYGSARGARGELFAAEYP